MSKKRRNPGARVDRVDMQECMFNDVSFTCEWSKEDGITKVFLDDVNVIDHLSETTLQVLWDNIQETQWEGGYDG